MSKEKKIGERTSKYMKLSNFFQFNVFMIPLFLTVPFSTQIGLLNMQEARIIMKLPLVLVYFSIMVVVSSLFVVASHKIPSKYDRTQESQERVNLLVKVYYMTTIFLTIVLNVCYPLFLNRVVILAGMHIEAMKGGEILLPFTFAHIGVMFIYSVLFYILYVRFYEVAIGNIPYTKKQMPVGLYTRNLLSSALAVIGVVFFCLAVVSVPRNYDLGKAHISKKMVESIILSFATFIITQFILTQDTVGTINKILDVTVKISKRNYNIEPIQLENRSELGIIIQNVNSMRQITNSILYDVQRSARLTHNNSSKGISDLQETNEDVESITTAINDVKSEMENQSAGVFEAQASAENITNAIASLNRAIEIQASGVTQSSAAVEEMVANIDSVTKILEKNSVSVKALADACDAGQKSVDAAVLLAKSVVEESTSIKESSKVLNTISNRTNLLAMNAAIEAAHAGEAGKGFAVVADEIRKLAEESNTQGQKISDQLGELQSAINSVAENTKEVQKQFEFIFELTGEVKTQDEYIEQAMEKQTAGSDIVLKSIDNIKTSSENIKDSSAKTLEGSMQVGTEMQLLAELTTDINGAMAEISAGASQITSAVSSMNEATSMNMHKMQEMRNEVGKFTV